MRLTKNRMSSYNFIKLTQFKVLGQFDHLCEELPKESRTVPRGLFSPDFPPDFDEQSCANRSWTDEKRFYELEAGLMKVFLVN